MLINCLKPNVENGKECSNAFDEMMSHKIIYKPALHVGVTSSWPFMHVTVVEVVPVESNVKPPSQVTVTVEPLFTVPVGSMKACSTFICLQSENKKKKMY